MRFFVFYILILFTVFKSGAQVTGGQSSFAYLKASNSAKIAGIGGDNVSSFGDDPSMIYQNPALLNKEMENIFSLSFIGLAPGIKLSSIQYVFDKSAIGPIAAGLTYLNYGKMVRRDAGGNSEGEFFSNEFVLHGTKTFEQGNYILGITPKLAVSQIAQYSSIATAMDIGGVFNHPVKSFTVGLTFQNIGFQIMKYTDKRENLPFDVVAGFSIKPEHMPLKISVTAHHLHQFDISYYDPSQKDKSIFEDDSNEYEVPIYDKIFRHFTVGGEVIISKNFHLRIGYNYLKRRELKPKEASGGAGFSFGFMIKVKAIEIDFSKTYFNYAGRPNYLTVNIDIDKLLKKKLKKLTKVK